jgi:hypothetical protein
MSVIKTVDGQDIDVNENLIVLIAGPYPHDVGPHTYVYGVTHGALVTGEPPDALVARLGINPPLAKLTRPGMGEGLNRHIGSSPDPDRAARAGTGERRPPGRLVASNGSRGRANGSRHHQCAWRQHLNLRTGSGRRLSWDRIA